MVDISIALAWLFEERGTPNALNILRQVDENGMQVPAIWWYELQNGVLTGTRRGRASVQQCDAFVKLVLRLPIQTDSAEPAAVVGRIIGLGRRHGLSAYDAAYLELAIRSHASLASFDQLLRRAAAAEGIALLPLSLDEVGQN